VQFLCQASKPAGCTYPLGFYKPSGSWDRQELGRAARDASEPLSAGRACAEANLSSKSQHKTIHDSHFFTNIGSTVQPPVTAAIPTPRQAQLSCRGCSGPPPCPPLRVSWGSQLAFNGACKWKVDGMGWDGMGWDGMGWDGMGLSQAKRCVLLLSGNPAALGPALALLSSCLHLDDAISLPSPEKPPWQGKL